MNDLDIIRTSNYFDAVFYSKLYTDVAEDPAAHYLAAGGREGRRPSAFFDASAYLNAYPDVASAGLNPLVHFLRYGILEERWAGLVPKLFEYRFEPLINRATPDDLDEISRSNLFDAAWYSAKYNLPLDVSPAEHYANRGYLIGWAPSARFDGQAYTSRYPDIEPLNPLLHYTRYGREEGRILPVPEQISRILEAELPVLAAIEPDLNTDDRLYLGFNNLDLLSSLPRSGAVERWKKIWESLSERVEHLVFVPWLVHGGAELAAVNVLKALQQKYGIDAVVMVTTDHPDTRALGWLPPGTRLVSFNESSRLSLHERRELVERIIWAVRPKTVYNVNSQACWEAIVTRGEALSGMTKMNALLFCREYNSDGRAVGYSDTHLRAALPYLHRVLFDTKYFLREVRHQYGLMHPNDSKLKYLPQPFQIIPSMRCAIAASERPRVLWAGRFARQKNIELLIKVIKLGSCFDFDIWGSGSSDIECQLMELASQNPNVRMRGAFSSLSEVVHHNYSAFLFTSHYEGMPTTILDIAAAGLPIVATAVGGVPEIVDDDTGWPIVDRCDPTPYVTALSQAVSNSALVQGKVASMRRRLEVERSVDVFFRGLFE